MVLYYYLDLLLFEYTFQYSDVLYCSINSLLTNISSNGRQLTNRISGFEKVGTVILLIGIEINIVYFLLHAH